MDISTKFKIGDIVFLMKNDKIRKGEVISISCRLFFVQNVFHQEETCVVQLEGTQDRLSAGIDYLFTNTKDLFESLF